MDILSISDNKVIIPTAPKIRVPIETKYTIDMLPKESEYIEYEAPCKIEEEE